MLVLGSSEGHDGCVIYVMNTDLVVILGGMTSQLLVLANNRFRHHLEQLCSERLLARSYEKSARVSCQPTEGEDMKGPPRDETSGVQDSV
jgi:hypothetical protein